MGKRYKEEYASVGSPVFVRAASDGRVVESGRFFLQGFNGDDFDLKATLPNVDVVGDALHSSFIMLSLVGHMGINNVLRLGLSPRSGFRH